MTDCAPFTKNRVRGKWLFLGAFIFSCFFFWWLRSLILREVIHLLDPVNDETIVISVLALMIFIAGYLLPASGRPRPGMPKQLLDACGDFAYRATLVIFFPALLIAIRILFSHINLDYGSGDAVPRPYQALLYLHLFFGFMCFGAADPEKQGSRRLWIAVALVTLPRLIISIHGARFILAQAVIPALLIAVARGWIHYSPKRILQIAALTLVILFVPAITRGDKVTGPGNDIPQFMSSNILGLFQDNTDLSIDDRCPPFLVSLTAKIIPYHMLGVCVMDIGGLKNMPATLERILTDNNPESQNGTRSGTGSIYLLELYVTGGIFAVYAGSALFGFSCRRFVGWLGKRSLFSGIWAECLTRALLAPRGNLSYVYERIPSLILATFLVIGIVWAGRLLKSERALISARPCRSLQLRQEV
ncbi:MAG: hypothetical protein ABSF70_00735 [Terracidiphilus sp.]|jgi:hypothetical protein